MFGPRMVWWRRLPGVLLAPLALTGCGIAPDPGVLLPNTAALLPDPGDRLVARFVQITDVHVLDEESPGRTTPADVLVTSAWRPQEAYSTQLLDGIIRAVNRVHDGGSRIDFVLFTGDLIDNAQGNELAWFRDCLRGGSIDPRSGPDERDPASLPPPHLDPHAPFPAQGLYQTGIHGSAPTIPWYAMVGNHDRYALGVFPIVEVDGRRRAPLPLQALRPGVWLPRWLEAAGNMTWGRITTADSGPLPLLSLPELAQPNPARQYVSSANLIATLCSNFCEPQATAPATLPAPDASSACPPDEAEARTWYSVSPVPGLRLIVLDTSLRPAPPPATICSEGFLATEQLAFLKREIDLAAQRDELVVLATHHPSQILDALGDSPVSGTELRSVLQAAPPVVLHLAGHLHRHRVIDRGTYIEMETAALIDYPQEGRVVEIWRDEADGSILLNYDTLGHLSDDRQPTDNPALRDDPLAELRSRAWQLAVTDAGLAAARRTAPAGRTPAPILTPAEAYGAESDRTGRLLLPAR